MKHSSFNSGFPASNPIANFFVIIVGMLAIGASIVLGFVAFVIVGSIVLIMASIIGIRVWWFKRTMAKSAGKRPGAAGPASKDGVIEGEYRVIADDRKGE